MFCNKFSHFILHVYCHTFLPNNKTEENNNVAQKLPIKMFYSIVILKRDPTCCLNLSKKRSMFLFVCFWFVCLFVLFVLTRFWREMSKNILTILFLFLPHLIMHYSSPSHAFRQHQQQWPNSDQQLPRSTPPCIGNELSRNHQSLPWLRKPPGAKL